MAALTVYDVTLAGIDSDANFVAAAGGGDTFKNDGQTFLHVKNGGVGSINVTITSQKTGVDVPGLGALTLADVVVAVPNGDERQIGPFSEGRFNKSDGTGVQVAYSGVTSVTVKAVRVPKAK